jgi:hypothetical protein
MHPDHLPDEILNEKLDQALDPRSAAEVESHLAECPLCTSRLDEMRNLLSDIASVPDLPIAIDLSRTIISEIELRSPSLPRPIRWLTVLQIICVLFSVIMAWPLVESLVSIPTIPTLDTFITSLTSSDILRVVRNLQWSPSGIELPKLGLDLTTTTLTITIAIAFVLWLTANSLLLIPPFRRNT